MNSHKYPVHHETKHLHEEMRQRYNEEFILEENRKFSSASSVVRE